MKKFFSISILTFILLLAYTNCTEDDVYYGSITENLDGSDSASTGEFGTFEDVMQFTDIDTIEVTVHVDSLDSLQLGDITLLFPQGDGMGCSEDDDEEDDDDSDGDDDSNGDDESDGDDGSDGDDEDSDDGSDGDNDDIDEEGDESYCYVTIQLIQYFTRKDMIQGNISNALYNSPLISAGGFQMHMYVDNDGELGEEIIWAGETGIIAKLPDQTDNSGFESVTNGSEGALNQYSFGSHINWIEPSTMNSEFVIPGSGGSYYELENVVSGYNQVASLMENLGGTQTLSVSVDNVEDVENTKVFYISNNYTTVVQLDGYQDNTFTSSLSLPSNEAGKILVIAWGDQIKTSIVEFSDVNNIPTSTLSNSSIDELNALLNTLNF